MVDRPEARSPVDADIDSGMLERKTATTMAVLTPAPSSRLMPMAADSGMPSSRAPSTRAAPPRLTVTAPAVAAAGGVQAAGGAASRRARGSCGGDRPRGR